MTVEAKARAVAKRRRRVLCVCHGGNVRSTTLARMWRKRGAEALACGVEEKYSEDTFWMLYDWSDVVFVTGQDVLDKMKARWPSSDFIKVSRQFDVGPDDWKIPDHPDLIRRYRAIFDGEPLVGVGGPRRAGLTLVRLLNRVWAGV